MAKAEYETYETFNLHVPTSCAGVPSELLNPRKSWTGKADFKEEVTKLAGLFVENFSKYADEASPEVISAGKCKDQNQQNRSNTVDVGPDISTNETQSSTDVPAPSEASHNGAHAPDLIELSEPTVNGETAGDESEVGTTSLKTPAEGPGFMTNGVEVSTEKRGNFTESNGVPDVVSDVTKAKTIRDSGIGFVNGEDSSSKS